MIYPPTILSQSPAGTGGYESRFTGWRLMRVSALRALSNQERHGSPTALALTRFWDVDIVAVHNKMLQRFQHKSGCLCDNASRPQRTHDAKTDVIEGLTSPCRRWSMESCLGGIRQMHMARGATWLRWWKHSGVILRLLKFCGESDWRSSKLVQPDRDKRR
jgi:hypothetical protein